MTVVGLYVADSGGAPVRSVATIEAIAGEGLRGDRYATGRGEWSYDARLRNDVTLIATEVLERVRAESGIDLGSGRSRRNIETTGVDLDALVGKRFRLGHAVLHGDRTCDPCRYLDRVTGDPAMAVLTGRGGLRATVLLGGAVAVGDHLVVQTG